MYLLGLGVIFFLLKTLEIGFLADWSWWLILSPFAMAVVWWAWADASGYTKRVEIEKMETRKKERIEKQREAMGMLSAKRNVKK